MCFFDETADASSPYCRRREHSRSRHLHGYIFGDFFQKVAYFQAFRVNSSRKFGLVIATPATRKASDQTEARRDPQGLRVNDTGNAWQRGNAAAAGHMLRRHRMSCHRKAATCRISPYRRYSSPHGLWHSRPCRRQPLCCRRSTARLHRTAGQG